MYGDWSHELGYPQFTALESKSLQATHVFVS